MAMMIKKPKSTPKTSTFTYIGEVSVRAIPTIINFFPRKTIKVARRYHEKIIHDKLRERKANKLKVWREMFLSPELVSSHDFAKDLFKCTLCFQLPCF